jgi:hypothetical protein
MYYAALWAAKLIRAGVGCGTCVGDSEVGFHLGSVPSGCPGLSGQNMNWGWGKAGRSTEEATVWSLWEPRRALCPSEAEF